MNYCRISSFICSFGTKWNIAHIGSNILKITSIEWRGQLLRRKLIGYSFWMQHICSDRFLLSGFLTLDHHLFAYRAVPCALCLSCHIFIKRLIEGLLRNYKSHSCIHQRTDDATSVRLNIWNRFSNNLSPLKLPNAIGASQFWADFKCRRFSDYKCFKNNNDQ